MKRMKKILLLILLINIFSFIKVNAASTSVVSLPGGDNLCEYIKNGKLKIGVWSFYGYNGTKTFNLAHDDGECSNSNQYVESDVAKGKPWTIFGRAYYNKAVYSDNTVIKYANQYGKYSPIYVYNKAKGETVSKTASLNPGERTFFLLNVKDKNIYGNSFKDLRFFIHHEGSSFNIGENNSIAYYVYTDKKTYGPYKMEYQSLYDVINTNPDSSGSKLLIYRVASSNLIKDIPQDEQIYSIKAYPYFYYDLHKTVLKVYSMYLTGYSNPFKNGKTYSGKIDGVSTKLRHNIVDNMFEEGSIKWMVNSKSPTVYHFHHYTSKPIIFPNANSKILYGIPYVNASTPTMSTWIAETTKKTTSTNTPYYVYNFATKYKNDVTAYSGKEFKKGDPVGSYLRIFEKIAKTDDIENPDTTTQRYAAYHSTTEHYVSNADRYIQGLDCSSSTFLANARELPYTVTLAWSHRYYLDYDVHLLGGLSFNTYELEKYLRDNKIISKDTQFTQDIYDQNYAQFILKKYRSNPQVAYNAYGIARPGDIMDTKGHVRMVSGYPHIVCKTGNKFTDNYKEGFCKSYGGIDPVNSYVIVTEVGGGYSIKKDPKHLNQNQTGWTVKINPNLTDITSVDDFYTPSKKLYSIMNFNRKYTIDELFPINDTKTSTIYLPFRYNEMRQVMNTTRVEIPNVKLDLDKSYSDINQAFLNKTGEFKRLQGTIISNYMLEEVKIVIDGSTYRFYPEQTYRYSLIYDLKNENIIKKISGLDYSKTHNIAIYVKAGPNLEQIQSAYKANGGYIEVVNTKGLTAKLPVKTKSIAFAESEINVDVNTTKKLSVTFNPTNVTNKDILWKSSSTAVATIDSTGTITAKKAGTTTITAQTRDNGTKATIKVRVITPVTSIKLDKTTAKINIGESVKLTATVLPTNASIKTVTWTSSDPSIATVSAYGSVKGKKAGTVTITATTNNNQKIATAKITVVKPTVKVTGITLNRTSATVIRGKTLTLVATITPSDATDNTVTWSSSDPTVATVSTSGVIKGLKIGTTTIKTTTKDGSYVATAEIKVGVPVSGITFSKSSTKINIGATEKVSYTITPSDATTKTVTWTTSNSNVAVVSSSGTITGKAVGTATITGTTKSNSKTATITVTVVKPVVKVTSVKLNKESTTINVGSTEKLVATVSPTNADNKKVTWKTSNSTIAVVSSTGTVTAKKAGTATITATTDDGSYTASATVKVVEPVVNVTKITLDKTKVTIDISKSEKVTATVTPSNATNKTVVWTSSNTKVATVSSYGNITAKGEGTATISAKAADNSNIKATVSVTVIKPVVNATGVTLNKTSATLNVGKSITLVPTVTPANVTDNTVTWSSSDEKVASVSSTGVVKALKQGKATITAKTSSGGFTSSAVITVTKPTVRVRQLRLNKSKTTITAGKTEKVSATIEPTDATNKNVTWTSSDPSIAKVSSSGTITGIKAGTAIITAVSTDNNEIKSAISVTIEKQPVNPTGVTIDITSKSLNKGEELTLNATVTPSDADNKTIIWTTSNSKIATVDENGKVIAVSAGTATITATIKDTNLKATSKITVIKEVVPEPEPDPKPEKEDPKPPENDPVIPAETNKPKPSTKPEQTKPEPVVEQFSEDEKIKLDIPIIEWPDINFDELGKIDDDVPEDVPRNKTENKMDNKTAIIIFTSVAGTTAAIGTATAVIIRKKRR